MKIELSEHFSYTKLIRFTIPTITMMIFTSIYGVVDGLFVSNYVSLDAFAAVNYVMPVLMILGSVGFMTGTGGSALVSKVIGEKKADLANKYFSMLIYFLVIAGFVLSIIGIVFLRPVMQLFVTEEKILNDCVLYGICLLCFLPFFMVQNAFQSFLVVAEKPGFGLKISILSGLTNMILDFLLIYVFKMGLLGAGLATGISQAVGACIPLIYFIRKNESKLKLVKTKIQIKPLLKSCANGSSEMLTNISVSLVSMLYNMQLTNYIGKDGVVAYGIIMYIAFIFSSVYMGYSIGMAPIVSYHYGANNSKELTSLFKKSMILMIVTSSVLTALAEILSGLLAQVFVSYDADLLLLTVKAIRLFSVAFPMQGINIFASSFFTALNNGFISALISFSRTLFFQIIMIFVLPLLFGVDGLWLAAVFSELLAITVSITCFVTNRKKYKYA